MQWDEMGCLTKQPEFSTLVDQLRSEITKRYGPHTPVDEAGIPAKHFQNILAWCRDRTELATIDAKSTQPPIFDPYSANIRPCFVNCVDNSCLKRSYEIFILIKTVCEPLVFILKLRCFVYLWGGQHGQAHPRNCAQLSPGLWEFGRDANGTHWS